MGVPSDVWTTFSWKNFCASRLLRFLYSECNLHKFSEFLKKTDREKNSKTKKLKIYILKLFWKKNRKSKKSKNRKIEKSNLISIENFRNSKIRKSKNSKIYNWNLVTFFDFSVFRFFRFFPTSDSSQKNSTEAIFKILVPGKSWDSPPQKTFRVHLANTYSK